MKKMTILSIITVTILVTACGAEEKSSVEAVNSAKTETQEGGINSAIKDMKKLATAKPKEEATKIAEKVVAKKTVAKTVTEKVKETPKVAVEQKIESIGEKKSVGEIITTAIGGTKTVTKSSDVFDYKLKPKKVAENVWCFFGALDKPTKENAGNMANSCYIKTADSYVLMDTGPSYQFAKQAYTAMKKIADLPVSNIFISHEHDDHWLGNDFYKKKFNAKLIGPESVNTDYKEGTPTRMFNILPKNAIEGTHIIKLDETPKKKKTIVVSGEKFDIIPMDTKAHSKDDIFIYMPERKILFAGDLVMNGRITSGRDGSVMGELKALAMMKKLDWNILIPGHGFITDKTAMDEAQLYFDLTKERVLKAIDEGVDATEINEVVKLIEFKDKAMYDILNAHNIGFAYDELEMLE
ncbi:beta lactamase precursor [hydrothermal vent metagenome]|uniref:Beta lactamase n=1 Tax=hydrothermal vent metagenome TaxID=652676 RepID=A0A1W1BAC3_9ZZZZ